MGSTSLQTSYLATIHFVEEIYPRGCPADISDQDEIADSVEIRIVVTLRPGDADSGNDVVDAVAPPSASSGAPTGSPSASPKRMYQRHCDSLKRWARRPRNHLVGQMVSPSC